MIVNTQLAQSTGCDQKDKWETPAHIFEKLDKEFNFTLDPCCEPETAKCSTFYTPGEDGLSKSWAGHTVFVNPPYSRGNIDKWVAKCYVEGFINKRHPKAATVVALLPVSTSANWWHKFIVGKAQLRFVERRVRFVGAPYTAPFSSVVVIWNSQGLYSFNQTPDQKNYINESIR